VVFAVPVLLPAIRRSLAREIAALLALPKEIEGATNPRQARTEAIEWTLIPAAILERCQRCEEILISASETRLIALRPRGALLNAPVPRYL